MSAAGFSSTSFHESFHGRIQNGNPKHFTVAIPGSARGILPVTGAEPREIRWSPGGTKIHLEPRCQPRAPRPLPSMNPSMEVFRMAIQSIPPWRFPDLSVGFSRLPGPNPGKSRGPRGPPQIHNFQRSRGSQIRLPSRRPVNCRTSPFPFTYPLTNKGIIGAARSAAPAKIPPFGDMVA